MVCYICSARQKQKPGLHYLLYTANQCLATLFWEAEGEGFSWILNLLKYCQIGRNHLLLVDTVLMSFTTCQTQRVKP